MHYNSKLVYTAASARNLVQRRTEAHDRESVYQGLDNNELQQYEM